MTVPHLDEFYLPILKFYEDDKPHSLRATYQFIVNYFNFNEDDLAETAPNNRPKYKQKTKIAISQLCKEGFLEHEDSRQYIISEDGLDFIKTNPKKIDGIVLRKFSNNININIENFGTINKSNINIGKINVIGGQNATGKSTASKLLYCFLKYCSSNRQEFAYEYFDRSIDSLFFKIRRRAIIGKDKDNFDTKNMNKPILDSKKIINHFMHRDFTIDEKIDAYKELRDEIYNIDSSNEIMMDLDVIRDDIEEIDGYINLVEEDGLDLYYLIMNNLLISEFSNKMKGFVEFKGKYHGDDFKFSSYFQDKYTFEKSGDLFINDVFYIDSFSCLDVGQSNGLTNTNHVKLLLNAIDSSSDESKDFFDPIKSKNIEKILECINSLIKGNFRYDDGELIYRDDYGVSCSMNSTASGIKQIGIIQLLLSYRKLKENSFLIIDEPEVNLHPEWQIVFAKILVILAKELNIHVYINTHSPMFIEAMSLYSEKYGLKNESNFYLTERHKSGGFYFNKIDNDDMGAVYENLSRPYDDLDKVKSDIFFNK